MRSLLPDLVAVPGGVLHLGSERGLPDERPRSHVEVAPFLAAASPTTNRCYDAFARATGREAPPRRRAPGFDAPDQPVVAVSWHDAVACCAWLAETTGVPLRLPTEVEREWAARGGLAGCDWPWGDEPPSAEAARRVRRPHAPAPGCANGYGLACMADNVHEWCADWYGPYGASRGPTGPPAGARRVSRGGSFRHAIPFTRVSARSSLPPDRRYEDYGFRPFADR